MATFVIKASKFLLPGAVQRGGYLTIQDGVFGCWTAEAPDGMPVVDCSGKWVAPGFVDTHIHGFYNHATDDCDADGINASSEALLRHGTTSWLPTTFTDSAERIEAACASIAAADESRGAGFVGARIQGIYLEGPFFTAAHVGAQNPAYLSDPNYELFSCWQEAAGGRIRKTALAPERDGSEAYCARVRAEGAVACIGHTDATFDQVLAAVNAGATCFVHTYNGMRGLHHREPGVVGAAMATRETYAELICDGYHVNPGAIRAMVNAKGWDHVALITDCLGPGGMPEGNYMSGGLPVVMRGGACYLVNGGNLAGSTATLAKVVKNVYDWDVVSAEQALRMATEVPARSAGIDGACGLILPSRPADFNVLNADLTLEATYLGGALVE
ncbi:N-acetylglucosamine-6-phosphate deacetylase [Paratractidigestivibacter sp.]|uniref:N-acetylglucosamine-6-phosphate deacetylase n=1 Tax=Paratractidigestivibacter sp. TaxID=2847316 RepID=UPI002AC94397|nr:N-acetylglucosamine-6-phosphate deacetylase [Paratractidigestivibacter sp.]